MCSLSIPPLFAYINIKTEQEKKVIGEETLQLNWKEAIRERFPLNWSVFLHQ